MQPVLSELNEQEILLFLGYKGQELTDQVKAQLDCCRKKIRELASPRLVYRRLPVEDGCIPGLELFGLDMKRLLANCREAVLMAVTLGASVEKLLMRTQLSDMAETMILDACASSAVENICDHFEMELRAECEKKGLFLTDRFSPGYGDLPLSVQKNWCRVLDTERRIGLTVTDRCLMVPRKSVTAILGISDKPVKLWKRSCESCSIGLDCSFRKCGRKCHE